MADNPPAILIIMTDGYAMYPKETATGGMPVLWIINNDDQTRPWGRVVRITS